MSLRSPLRRTLPAGPVLTVLLVGVLVLSALLYYRAVKIQRFLEPALALSIPRSEFSHQLTDALVTELGSADINGINIRSMSFLIAGPLLFGRSDSVHAGGRVLLRKVARAFRSVLQDERTRPDVGFVLVIVRYPGGITGRAADGLRESSQWMAWEVLDTVFAEEPLLRTDFGSLFSAVTAPGTSMLPGERIVEFRIVPSERMHIEFLQKLEKYTH